MFRERLNSTEKIYSQEISLLLNRRFLNQIVEEVIKNPNPDAETGGIILGLREVRNDGQIFIVPIGSVNAKDDEELERNLAHLNIGGAITNVSRKWQVANWSPDGQTFYEDFGFKANEPNKKLTVVGIWHKHPGSYIGYSGEDSGTVNNILKQSKKEDFIFPVAILRKSREGGAEPISQALKLVVNEDTFIDIMFYYRNSKDGITSILSPNIYNLFCLPELAPSPWYVNDPIFFKRELVALKENGFIVEKDRIIKVIYTPRQGLPHPETWLELKHNESKKIFYARFSYRFEKDGVLFITTENPTQEQDFTQGVVIFVEKSQTIAEAIKSYIDKFLTTRNVVSTSEKQ